MADDATRSRTIDEATLRDLAQLLARPQEVAGTSLFPPNKQESLLVNLKTTYYPAAIDAVELELRVFTNGDFHVTYVETYAGERRRCRWDRHEQDHNTRDHFHPLPEASTADAADRDFPADVTTLLEQVVLPWVENRLGTIWEG